MALREVLPTSTMIFPENRGNISKVIENQRMSLRDPGSYWRKVADELFWYEKNASTFEEIAQPPYGR